MSHRASTPQQRSQSPSCTEPRACRSSPSRPSSSGTPGSKESFNERTVRNLQLCLCLQWRLVVRGRARPAVSPINCVTSKKFLLSVRIIIYKLIAFSVLYSISDHSLVHIYYIIVASGGELTVQRPPCESMSQYTCTHTHTHTRTHHQFM